tara:strand:+ start:930 stop:1799 length:870 start_codon:yes stop_codon:yes gene_type:complete
MLKLRKWQNLLNEAREQGFPADKERYLGSVPEECIQAYITEMEKDPEEKGYGFLRREAFERCMTKAGFEPSGEPGAFRAVFSIPDQRGMVLKVAIGHGFISDILSSRAMNKAEAQNSYQTKYQDLVPKVYDAADDYFWIKLEKATPIVTYDQFFSFFPAIKGVVEQYGLRPSESQDFFINLVDAAVVMRKNLDSRGDADYIEFVVSKSFALLQNPPPGERRPALLKRMLSEPLFQRIVEVYAEFNIPLWDIRTHNVGYAWRDGKRQFVILDPGFGLDSRSAVAPPTTSD